jgi:hypothetical protein
MTTNAGMLGTLTVRARDRVAGRECPICGERGDPIGDSEGAWLRLCCGSLLAWEWANEAAYEAWYWDPEAYHVVEQ